MLLTNRHIHYIMFTLDMLGGAIMEQTKVNHIIMMVKNDIPDDRVYVLTEALEKADDKVYNHVLSIPMKSKTTTLLLSIFLGGLGADRFYIGDIGLGVAKLLFGWFTFGIWPLVDIFMTYKKCKEINFQKIMSLL